MDEYGDVILQEDQYYWLFHANDSYSAVKLLQLDDDECTVADYETEEKSVVSVDSLVGMIPAPGEITLRTIYDDLTEAVDISEASILWNMKKKYDENKIYSSIGPILIALNPYCHIDALYSDSALQSYIDGYENQLPPHIWSIAKASFEQLKLKSHRQAIVISGESGAGKTETTKKCLQYLSAVSMGSEQSLDTSGATVTPIEDRVLGSNPILESFGNAKTCRNNNSSRFGKWLEINFSCGMGKFTLIGANITQYLLEKSRVVYQAADERNYHIFYQMCADDSNELGSAEDYAYLNQSGCTEIEGVDDLEDFQQTKAAYVALNFPPRDVAAIFDALKAILHMGNINFENASTGEGSIIAAASWQSLQLAASLLGFSEEALSVALLNRTLTVLGEVMVVPLDPSQAVDTRNAFSKEIYGRLFAQIVHQANKSLSFKIATAAVSDKKKMKDACKIVSIGLLDIFGFEIFVCNSFEQLCINYGNEKLQQYFINFVLKKEQETYESEGIDVDQIETIDNEDILQFLELKKTGLFALLDEELRLPKGSDSGFLSKVEKEHKDKTSRFRQNFRMRKDNFEIQHFAGVVLYDATSFLDKNKDKLYDHLEDLLGHSAVPEFRQLMETNEEPEPKGGDANKRGTGAKKAAVTLASRFTGQLQALVTVLQESEPHFVRCLKPNSEKSASLFESQLVLQQLRYSGVLEAIQIRKSGYPTRKVHKDFYASYRVLAGLPLQQLKSLPGDKQRCEAILAQISLRDEELQDIRVGRTMIFYRPVVHNLLENWRMAIGLRAVLYLQAGQRRVTACRRVKLFADARASLVGVMDMGSEQNTCNIEAISYIHDNVAYCDEIGLPCVYVITKARSILERLEIVKSCLDKLSYYLSSESSQSFDDITIEFTTINTVINEAEAIELAVDHPLYVALRVKRDDMQARAAVVLELREVMQQLDEVTLGDCLERYAALRDHYGDFCEDERRRAADLFDRMARELRVIEDSISCLSGTQKSLSARLESVEQQAGGGGMTEALKASMAPISNLVEPLLGPQYIFATEPARNITKAFEIILEIRIQWALSDWNVVAATVVKLLEEAKHIWPTDCVSASASLQRLAGVMAGLITDEVALVSGGIDVHVILPLLCCGLQSGGATTSPDSECGDMAADIAPLESAITSVRQFVTIGPQAKTLLSFVESVLVFRNSVIADDFETILALTEPVQVTTYRYMRSSELLKSLNQTSCSQYMEAAKNEDGISYALFPRRDLTAEELPDVSRLHRGRIRDRSQGLPPALNDIVESVAREVAAGRVCALNRYSQSVLLSALEQWRTTLTSSSGKIVLLTDELSGSLRASLAEVSSLWESDLVAKEGADQQQAPFTKRLMAMCEKLSEARTLLRNEEYDRIIGLNRDEHFKFNLVVKGRLSGTPLVSKILTLAVEELQIIVAESRNVKAEKLLLASFEVGCVTGVLGQIEKSEISYDKVSEAIRTAETCLAEDLRESSPLQTLVDVASALVACRKAFQPQQPDPADQRAALKALLALQSHFPALLTREVEVMSNEVDYNDCQALLDDGLEWDSSYRYLTASRRSSIIGRSSSMGDDDNDDEEGKVPNKAVLAASRLEGGLEVAARLQQTLGDSALFSTKFIDMCKAATFVQSVRQAVMNSDWEAGESVLKAMKQSGIAERVGGGVKEEVAEASQVVSNAVHVLFFERALCSGKPKFSSVDLTIVDLSDTSIGMLEKSIDRYQLNAGKSKKAKALYNAALSIRDLRRALLGGDWGSMSNVLKQLREGGVGRQKYTAECLDEIEVVSIAVQNQSLIRSLKLALLDEVVQGKPGSLDMDKIRVTGLVAAMSAVMSVDDGVKGGFLRCLTALAEHVIMGRKAAAECSWSIIRSIADMWLERVSDVRAAGRAINEQLMSVRPRTTGDEAGAGAGVAAGGGSPGGTSVSFSSTSQFNIKEFEYLATVLTNEVNCVHNHVTMHLLEADVLVAIQEGGVSSKDMVGNIDLSVIRTDGLETVLERKTKLENDTNSSLPDNVEKLCKAAQLILQIRKEILLGNWSSVPALLEEAVTGSYHPLPDACRQEVQVIRLECENRWVITMLTNSLSSGGMEGTVDEHCPLEEVESASLSESVSFCTTLKPQTELAMSLLETCQLVLQLRQLLQTTPVDWHKVMQLSEVSAEQKAKLYCSGLVEINLIHVIAENTVVCSLMERCLQAGGPRGEPGHLDVSHVTAEQLLQACRVAEQTSVKSSKTNELFNACQLVASLREALVYSSQDREEALSTVKFFVKTIHDIHAKNPKDHGWAYCKTEISLVTKDAHMQELNGLLQNSVAIATQVYAHRQAASIGSKTSSRRQTASQAPPAELQVDSLDEILKYAEEIEFSSQVLDDLIGCARALRLLRMAMIKEDWEYGSQLAKRDDIINPISSVPFAIPELNYAKQEAHNKITATRLEAVLTDDFVLPGCEQTDDDMRHTYLANRIQEAEESDLTANSAKQLLECAKNVLLLRVGFSAKDSKQVATALRWFSMNAYRCPPCVQEEAQKAYIMHQNSLLVTGLTAALQVGYATGVVGDLNISSIDTQTISKLLVQAKAVKHKTPEVKELVDMAEMIYALRCAQRASDPRGVAKAMSFMSGRNKVLPAICVQEIAFARIEKDNELTLTALKKALTTFDDSASKSLEISLHNSEGKDSQSFGTEEHKMRSKTPPPRVSSAKKSRRYSLANMNRADIDVDSIDIQSLDEGMEAARLHGLFTAETKQLFRTVSVIKLLRVAMKVNDWPHVEKILQDIEAAESTQGKLHPLADNEIMTIEKQLEMRTSIVDLSKTLKGGWARCSNGIVDTDKMQINSLIDAIRRAEKSMEDLGLSHVLLHSASSLQYSCSTKKGDVLSAITFKDIKSDLAMLSPSLNILQQTFFDAPSGRSGHEDSGSEASDQSKTKAHRHVERLLLSALITIDVRKALYEGRIQHAGSIAEAALACGGLHATVLEEMSHYATEIGRALQMMRLCDQLREGMRRGDSAFLRPVIRECKESKVSLSDDLGLLRTLEKAQAVFRAIVAVEKRLKSVVDVYKTEDIQSMLDTAKQLGVTGPLVEAAAARLTTLLQFNTGVSDLKVHSGGLATGKVAQQLICDLAASLHVPMHPAARRARVLLQLNDPGHTVATLAEACATSSPYSAATQTIRYKRSLLKLPEFQDKFTLEKFERLRDPSIFTMRLALQYKEQKSAMLKHSDTAIGTSLTILTPVMATLAVQIFTHIVKVIDEQASSAPEVLLRNLISIGRSCPAMRDEILLQVVKQLRSNPSEESESRVWYMLRACCKHFPPSHLFENHLECFLLSCINARMDTRSHLAQQCIRNMHQSIFLYGYNRKVFSAWNSSLRVVKVWLSPVAPTEDLMAPPAISKPLGINAKCELFYGALDPAFSLGHNNHIGTAKLIPSASLRGTSQNWTSRFEQLRGAGQKGVTMTEFATAMFSKSSKIDAQDREVLMFWLCGILPTDGGDGDGDDNVIFSLSAELWRAGELLLPLDSEEEHRMLERRQLLRGLRRPSSRRLSSVESKGEAVAVFFELVEHCAMKDRALLSFTTQTSEASRRERARSIFAFSPGQDGSPVIEEELEDQSDDEVLFTPVMYRDFVHVGMEKIVGLCRNEASRR